jgi:D-alanyl-D-alanine carboxypeptidase
MKNLILYFSILTLLAACQSVQTPITSSRCETDSKSGSIQNEKLENALSDLVSEGIPGVALAVYANNTWWTGAKGYARIEDQTMMQTCNLQYLQSVAKLYMAVGILKLYEEGKIDLNAPITKYLRIEHSKHISNAETISVRMLLNHTSGIPEYNLVPLYVTRLLQNPDEKFSPEEYLHYVSGKPLDFEPGSRYSYRNTNYVLLALIADALAGDHAQYLGKVIFEPLALTNTFYRGSENYLNYSELVNAYWDRYSNGIVENASNLQHNNVAALVGDDGIVATPEDAVKFLKGLMEGKLLRASTLDTMKVWAKDRKGNNAYGLGLDYAILGGKVAYGHSGGGIGAGCQLYYIPEKDLYFFVGINLGTVTDSPLHKLAAPKIEKLYSILFE